MCFSLRSYWNPVGGLESRFLLAEWLVRCPVSPLALFAAVMDPSASGAFFGRSRLFTGPAKKLELAQLSHFFLDFQRTVEKFRLVDQFLIIRQSRRTVQVQFTYLVLSWALCSCFVQERLADANISLAFPAVGARILMALQHVR